MIRRRSPTPSSWPRASSSPGTHTRWPPSRIGSIPADLQEVRVAAGQNRAWRWAACPEIPLLVAPTVANLQQACGAELWRGNPELLAKESMGFVVAAMSLPNVLTRLREDFTIIAPGRPLRCAARADPGPPVGDLPESGLHRADRRLHPAGFGSTVDRRGAAGPADPGDDRRDLRDGVQTRQRPRPAHRRFDRSNSRPRCAPSPSRWTPSRLLAAIDVAESNVVTPLMFQYRVFERARADRRHIVMPEGEDERILRATAILLRLGSPT